MKNVLLIISIVLGYSCAHAQQDTIFRSLKMMQGDFSTIAVDNLDNLYTLSSRNQLKKYNANGDSVAVYNDVKQYGPATLLDVSNPLKILLYYHDFATVVTLDRFLKPVNVVDLRKQQIFQAKAVGLTYDNRIWVYDEAESKLKKIDEEGKTLQETPDFRQLLGKAINPIRIFDENKYVYLYDTLNGVYVFDYFGNLKNNIMISQWNNFSISGKYIYGTKAGVLYRYDIGHFNYEEWVLPDVIRASSSFCFSPTRLYALMPLSADKQMIAIYSFK